MLLLTTLKRRNYDFFYCICEIHINVLSLLGKKNLGNEFNKDPALVNTPQQNMTKTLLKFRQKTRAPDLTDCLTIAGQNNSSTQTLKQKYKE